MKIEIGKTYLVSTNDWFLAPDGETYKGAFGTAKGIYSDEASLGIKTNRGSTNWYIEIGNLMIAGCQIHYAIRTDKVSFEPPIREIISGGVLNVVRSPITRIYNADEDYKF